MGLGSVEDKTTIPDFEDTSRDHTKPHSFSPTLIFHSHDSYLYFTLIFFFLNSNLIKLNSQIVFLFSYYLLVAFYHIKYRVYYILWSLLSFYSYFFQNMCSYFSVIILFLFSCIYFPKIHKLVSMYAKCELWIFIYRHMTDIEIFFYHIFLYFWKD